MKILICFIDMFRGQEELKNKKLELFLKNLGGKYYENAYSISLDTFRSFSSTITGKYPFEIGTSNSCFVPELFLNTDRHIFNIFEEKKYSIYMRIDPYFSNFSLVPKIEKYNLYNNIEELVESYKQDFTENKLIFYYDENYHDLISRQNTKKQELRAREQVVENLKYLFSLISKDEFDKILIFSDHGCTLVEDKVEDMFDVKDNRSKVFLYLKDKNEIKLKKINNFVSLLDIYPTILEWLKMDKDQNLRGISLEKPDLARENIYIEDGYCDYQGFPLNKNQLEKYYKVREKSSRMDRIYYFKDINTLIIKEPLLYMTSLKKILKIKEEIKNKKIIKFKNLDKSFLDNNGNIKKYNSNTEIKNEDLYNKCTSFQKIKWKIFKIRLYLKKKGLKC